MPAKKGRSLDYDVKPFAGAHAPAGVSQDVNRALVEHGLMERGAPNGAPAAARQEPAPKPPRSDTVAPPRPTPAPTAPPRPTARPAPRQRSAGNATAPKSSQPDTRRTPRAGAKASADERIQRTVRLTPLLDKKLRELAEARGIDMNAAVSVAIAEDWKQTCRR